MDVDRKRKRKKRKKKIAIEVEKKMHLVPFKPEKQYGIEWG